MYSQPMATGSGPLRIGEFARRVGVTPELLRAWERRYGLLQPVRSPGGSRLYTDQDAERVARMRRALHEGLSAAEAARAALARGQPSAGLLQDAAARLLAAIERYDEPTAHAVLDESLAAFGLGAALGDWCQTRVQANSPTSGKCGRPFMESSTGFRLNERFSKNTTLLGDVILPTLTQVGLGWEQGTLQISQEHFASNLIRGRLLSLARLWSRGGGSLALLACPPGEAHDISLLAFGLLLRSHGWRILFLGADTPISTLTQTATTTRPAVTVLTSFNPALLQAEKSALRRLAKIGSPGMIVGGDTRTRVRFGRFEPTSPACRPNARQTTGRPRRTHGKTAQ